MNKSAQSNLGRRPRRGAVAHIRRKVPICYNGAPQIRPQKYPYPGTDPQTPLLVSSLDLSHLWCQMASGSDPPFSTMHWTDRPTHVQTDRPIVHGKVWRLWAAALQERRGLIKQIKYWRLHYLQGNGLAIHKSRVRVLDRHHCIVVFGKLLTPVCVCHQAVQFGTSQGAVISFAKIVTVGLV